MTPFFLRERERDNAENILQGLDFYEDIDLKSDCGTVKKDRILELV